VDGERRGMQAPHTQFGVPLVMPKSVIPDKQPRT
jgi:hypothetical protein